MGSDDQASGAVLPDGVYDAVVVDVEPAHAARMRVELTIVAGAHKGAVVAVQAPRGKREPLELMGLPVTLEVVEGRPRLEIEG